MLKFGNKEFRNLQEQVFKNMHDIENLVASGMILDEFGIKVVGQEASIIDMPTVEAYKEAHEDWAYGDAYAIGTTEPYELYILTRANETHADDYWFNIGEFPAVGPQGPQGEEGPQGPQGQTGPSGVDGLSAGFGTVSASAITLEPGSEAQVSLYTTGPDTAKNFYFTFGIPKGEDGEVPAITTEWGDIGGTLSDQTDLVTALQGKQNTLVSGTNIKTINNESILGSGNIDIQSAVWGNITGTLSNQTDLQTALNGKLDKVTTPTSYGQLYAKDINGGQSMIDFSTSAANSIVRRSGSHLYAGTPTDVYSNTDAVPKDYVDNYHDATKQDAIADLSTIRAGAALGATAVQPAAIANMVTTTGEQTISGDKTFSGKLNKNTNGYGIVMPSTTSYTQNKTLATTDLIKEIYQHYITFKANSNKTVISVKVLTQSNTPMTASEFFSFVNDELPDSTGNIIATGTIHISNVDHKYVGAIGKGGTSSIITVYPLVSTGGYDSIVSLDVSAITTFVDVVDRVGAHGAGASGSIITRQDIIDALGYIPSHVDANPSSTTGTLTGIGIDGINYAIQGGSGGAVNDVEVNGTSVVTAGVANIDLTGYALTSSLADVATTGSYNDLINKPTIPVVPTNVSAFNNDAGYITSSALSGYATETWVTNQGYSTFSGNYNDLTNKPSIPTKTSDLTNDSGFITGITSSDVTTALGYTPGTSNFSGDYDDLTDKPTIPTISGTNDGTYWTSLTINSDTYAVGGSAPSNMVTTDTAQTITGTKTVSRINFENSNNYGGYLQSVELASTYDSILLSTKTGNSHIGLYGTTVGIEGNLLPSHTNTTRFNLGGPSGLGIINAWQNLYLSGKILRSTNNDYGLQLPITTNFTADKVLATTDQIPTYTAGDWIGINNNVISVSNPYISLLDSNNMPRIMISDSTSGTAPTFTGKYLNITPNGFGINDRTSLSTNQYTYYKHDEIVHNGSYTLTLPNSTGTIALTSDIPTVPTNVSAFTNDAGYITSSAISDMATQTWVGQQGYQTASDVSTAISSQTKETWTFTLSDGTTTTKTIVLG